jgi:hypothetical protein
MDPGQLDFAPPKNWQDFEDICHQLWRREWDCKGIQKHGRTGQKQKGVDIYGVPSGKSEFCGIQCKLKSRQGGELTQLTSSEIEQEVAEAESFEPPLAQLVIATTAPSDIKIQEFVRKLSASRTAKGKFAVEVYSWQEILLRIVNYPELLKLIAPATPQPLAPSLELKLTHPAAGTYAIPAARDRAKDLGERKKDIEEAAQKCGQLRAALNDLLCLHHAETSFLRQVPIILSLSNRGQQPADDIEVELSFLRDDEVSTSRNDGKPKLTLLTCGQEDWEKETDKFKLVSLIYKSRWYPPAKPENALPSYSPGEESLQVHKADGQKRQFRARLKKLKQGKSINLQCFFVSFHYAASSDIEIEYNIFADNMPFVANGKISVRVDDS